jgi:hypothetical protein
MALKNGYYNRGAGASFVPAYQISGVPFVTSSNGNELTATVQKISFPYATRFFQITNTGNAPMRIGFSENGVNGVGGSVSGSSYEKLGRARCLNYLVLSGSGMNSMASTVRLEIRCKELFLKRDGSANTGFSLIAGLTGVESSQFPILTGSQGFRGVG